MAVVVVVGEEGVVEMRVKRVVNGGGGFGGGAEAVGFSRLEVEVEGGRFAGFESDIFLRGWMVTL